MATAAEYAAWIVQNADKKGTPDFETVARAYQAAKAREGKIQDPSLLQEEKPETGFILAPVQGENKQYGAADFMNPLFFSIIAISTVLIAWRWKANSRFSNALRWALAPLGFAFATMLSRYGITEEAIAGAVAGGVGVGVLAGALGFFVYRDTSKGKPEMLAEEAVESAKTEGMTAAIKPDTVVTQSEFVQERPEELDKRLRGLKALLDDGVITQPEFDQKKAEMLREY